MSEFCILGSRRATFIFIFFVWVSLRSQVYFCWRRARLNYILVDFSGWVSLTFPFFWAEQPCEDNRQGDIFNEIKNLSPNAALGKYIIKSPPVCLKMQKYIFPMSWNYWFLSLNSRLGGIMNLIEILPV